MTISLFMDNGGDCHIEFYGKTASTAFTFNDVMMLSASGLLVLYTDSANLRVIGLVQKAIASTDSDYASETRIPVLVCGSDAEYLCDIGNGTGAAGDVGELIDFDGAGSAHQNVDVSNSQFDMLEVTKFISTTQVVCKFIKPHTGVLHTGPA